MEPITIGLALAAQTSK